MKQSEIEKLAKVVHHEKYLSCYDEQSFEKGFEEGANAILSKGKEWETEGLKLVAKERQEQIEKHGRTAILDIEQNSEEQLRIAARKLLGHDTSTNPPKGWDETIWRKMVRKPRKEQIIIAAALLIAELDRITPPKD